MLGAVGSLLAALGLHPPHAPHAMRRALSAALGSALTDALTGAPNRLAFEEALASEHARVVRGSLPAGLFLVDLDRFKSVNDRYGHQVGDRVLIGVVDRLRRMLRRYDLVCRWGGEELAVLAPGLADAGRRGGVRRAPARPPSTGSRSRSGCGCCPVTVSIGGTLLDGTADPQAAVGARRPRALPGQAAPQPRRRRAAPTGRARLSVVST